MNDLSGFSAPTREWFTTTFGAPTDAQARGWPAIAAASISSGDDPELSAALADS